MPLGEPSSAPIAPTQLALWLKSEICHTIKVPVRSGTLSDGHAVMSDLPDSPAQCLLAIHCANVRGNDGALPSILFADFIGQATWLWIAFLALVLLPLDLDLGPSKACATVLSALVTITGTGGDA